MTLITPRLYHMTEAARIMAVPVADLVRLGCGSRTAAPGLEKALWLVAARRERSLLHAELLMTVDVVLARRCHWCTRRPCACDGFHVRDFPLEC